MKFVWEITSLCWNRNKIIGTLWEMTSHIHPSWGGEQAEDLMEVIV